MLIDFEYAAYNYSAFDVGNTFVESMFDYENFDENGFDFDETRYPTYNDQIVFAKNYLGTDDEEELKKFITEADEFAAVSHFMWSIWSIVQNAQQSEKSEFDYLKYCDVRYSLFKKMTFKYRQL